jgi:hypothetical protein
MPTACALCARFADAALPLDALDARICLMCATRLGQALVNRPEPLAAVWPSLASDEDDDEPEPRLRLPDGSSVEVRERTAALKQELTLDARMKLALALGELGLHREQALDCGHVLCADPPEHLARIALETLFEQPLASKDPLALLRELLYPS